MTGSDADALDATQEALVAIVRGLPRFDGRSSFATWAYRIAVNCSLDELRRRRRRPTPDSPALERLVGASAAVDAPGAQIDVDELLADLAPEFRAVVVLRDVLDLDYAAIGAVLDIPIGTVRSRLARARAQLAARARELSGTSATSKDRP